MFYSTNITKYLDEQELIFSRADFIIILGLSGKQN